MSFIRDLIVSIAAIVTATVACIGISNWRAEESGKADFDLARRLGKAVFQFRDALADARRAFIPSSEFPERKVPSADSGEGEASAYAYVFNQRFKGVQQSAIEILALRNEAEALWGEDIAKKLAKLISTTIILRVAMNAVIADKRAFGTYFGSNEIFASTMIERALDPGNALNNDGTEGPPNEFTVKIEKAVEDVSAYLRTKLPTKSARH